jgi:hypothetical protein
LKNPFLDKALDLLLPVADPAIATDRSRYERLALPHSFKPRLSFFEACVALFVAVIRIILGSLLFAVWGTYSLMAWSTIHTTVLRVSVMVPLLLLFFLFFAILMIAISAAVRVISHGHI